MKIFLFQILVMIGFVKVYSGTAQYIISEATKIEVTEGSDACSGCHECGSCVSTHCKS